MTRSTLFAVVGVVSVVVLGGCSSDDASEAAPTPSAVVVEEQQADAPLEIPGIPAPSATLTAPAAPTGDSIATEQPEQFAQFVPPDITLSGIAVAVSSTVAQRGQTVQFAAQAAPELSGHTAYLVTEFGPGAQTLGVGQVGQEGRFTLDLTAADSTSVVVVVAAAGVARDADYNFDDIVARSEDINLTVR